MKKKPLKAITYLAGIVDMLSLLALDSEQCWIPIAGTLVSTAWLVLVAHATFEKEEDHHKKTRGDQAGNQQTGADQAAHDRPDPSDLEEAGRIV